MSELFSHPVW